MSDTQEQVQQVLGSIYNSALAIKSAVWDIVNQECTDDDLAELRLIDANLGAVEDDLERVGMPEFPYEAWDIVADEPVTVIGWCEGKLHLDSGYASEAKHITTIIPAWYVKAQQELADAADLQQTQADALNVGVQ